MLKLHGLLLGCLGILLGLVFTWRGSSSEAKPSAADGPQGGAVTADAVCLRIQLGLKDQENTSWDGSIQVSPGKIVGMEVWRQGVKDTIDGTTWIMGTRPAPRFTSAAQRGKTFPPSENGLIVTLAGVNESSQVSVTTKQGDFSFKLSEVPFGKRRMALEGAADIVRIPASYRLAGEGTEEDYPAAAVGPDGTVWIAYVAFTHGKDFVKPLRFGDEEPRDLSMLDQPTGGDQVFAIRMENGRWSAPMPVTPGGEDLYKVAIAVDGKGNPRVFFSGQKEGNFDLYSSALRDGKWTSPERLTRDPGPDINPAAATDGEGRVWVVWQGFRGDNSNILAMRCQGDRFSEEIAVSADAGNQWDPAIAVSKTGELAVAWDTYTRGNYDVCCRVAKKGEDFGPAFPVAASLKQEVHASATYDSAGRLWVAWEEGPERWGKDFGALAKEGAPLYSGGTRSVLVRCFEGGQVFQPTAEPGRMAAAAGPRPRGGGRKAGEERQAQLAGARSLPRLATDAAGRVWLAYRARQPHFWCSVGTVWFEYLTCYEGDEWLPPIYVHNSDNILDNRPALAATPDGAILLVGSSDGRQEIAGRPRGAKVEPETGRPDPVNSDLFLSTIALAEKAAKPAALAACEPAVPAEPEDTTAAENAAVARCRSYRIQIGGKSLQLMRGEFHRHTELSTDGGGDGSLIDMYRYALDAASMDWIGNGDHDNNNNREYPWWITQKTADAVHAGPNFVPMFSYERSVSYPDGHRNPIFAKRGVRTLPRFGKPGTGRDDQQPAHTPDTQLLYRYLKQFDGLCASHTSATDMGTDWRDNDPLVEPVVEIYQGCRQNYEEPGAPRAPSADDAIGGWRPNGFVWRALAKGYRLGFQSSSDHTSVHISYCNVWAESPTREAIFQAMKQRHVYGATDNIIADVRCGKQMMGDEFETSSPPSLAVKLIGTAPFKRIDIVKNNTYVYSAEPKKAEVDFTWTDMAATPGTAYYYVRGEQEDGELVWVSPMWITVK